MRSFKRNDHRIRKQLSSKYGRRKKERVKDILNKISKDVVITAKENSEAIVLEDITHIKSMYQKGNGQGSKDRKRQIWCKKCKRWFDRDMVAVMNISYRGWVRFDHSKGAGSEAMKGNPTTPVILLVDTEVMGFVMI